MCMLDFRGAKLDGGSYSKLAKLCERPGQKFGLGTKGQVSRGFKPLEIPGKKEFCISELGIR